MVPVFELLSTTWLGFQSFPLLHAGREGQAEASTTSNNTKSGSLSIACVQLGSRKLSVIRSSGVSAIQGLLKGVKSVAMSFKDWRSGVAWLPEMFFMVIMLISGYHAVVLCNYHRLRMVIGFFI